MVFVIIQRPGLTQPQLLKHDNLPYQVTSKNCPLQICHVSVTYYRQNHNVTGLPEITGVLKESPNIGKPPRHVSSIRHSVSSAQLAHATEVECDGGIVSSRLPSDSNSTFVPIFRSGSCSEIGSKPYMEDEHICIDNLLEHLGATENFPSPGAFYGVCIDGHGGTDAASFIRENILRFIIEDIDFPFCVEKAIKSAFLNADQLLLMMALLIDPRIVELCWGNEEGRVELSNDHKPNSISERSRIEKLGGVVYDGYLNGQLSVARALGDWHMKGTKGSSCPLSAEPELQETILSEEDEFLIIGCDGLWDVMSSQCAVTMARKELMLHNDPERCSRELVREALKRNSCDNLTVVIICFSPDPPPRLEFPKFKFSRSISAEGLNLLQEALDSGKSVSFIRSCLYFLGNFTFVVRHVILYEVQFAMPKAMEEDKEERSKFVAEANKYKMTSPKGGKSKNAKAQTRNCSTKEHIHNRGRFRLKYYPLRIRNSDKNLFTRGDYESSNPLLTKVGETNKYKLVLHGKKFLLELRSPPNPIIFGDQKTIAIAMEVPRRDPNRSCFGSKSKQVMITYSKDRERETDVRTTSSAKIVAYEPELKSSIESSVVLALTVRSFSSDKTNLKKEDNKGLET
ncbi:hypothetical protein F8388_007876 [Cannabis sativa]|uniref:PPM-type phosphatase domain-containing protein n=1 Tax=Cannabis sativa TaxID=3483 RepID=A0A7J6FW49_CANSA|nr:hypothetical protein F8388_007876 [Cannabis sativa]